MSPRRALQVVDALGQADNQLGQVADQPRQTYGTWLTAEHAAAFLDFHGKGPVAAFRMWAKRAGVHTAHRGSRVLYAKADLLRAIGADSRRSV